MEYKGEKTPLDIKYETLLDVAPAQAQMSEFRGLPNFDQSRLADDTYRLEDKKRGEMLTPDDRDAKALEAIVTYLGNNDELFDGCSYADPGSEFDDSFHGADVVCGMKVPGREYDVIFSLDVSSAVLPTGVSRKFNHIDQNTERHPDIPGTSRLDYYAHTDRDTGHTRHTRIARVPNYVVGARPATVGRSVDKFNFSESGAVHHETDRDLQIELLVEIYLQASAQSMACRNLSKEQRGKNTAEVAETHRLVAVATRDELIRLSGSTDNPPNFTIILNGFIKQYREDDTFRSITGEAIARHTAQLNRSKAQKAMDVARKQQPKSTNPDPAAAPA